MSDQGRSRERRLPEQDSTRRWNPGFTLIELLISLVIGMVVLAALYAVFTIQSKNFVKQEQIGEMQQIARSAMDAMAREITMAGYDPNQITPANAGITTPPPRAQPTSVSHRISTATAIRQTPTRAWPMHSTARITRSREVRGGAPSHLPRTFRG